MLRNTLLATLTLLASNTSIIAEEIPFKESLSRADIRQDRIDHVLDHGLIIGNGDINALIYSIADRIIVSLTKNDVWDARLLTENDPPLPTMTRLKELVAEGWPDAKGGGDWILPEGYELKENDSYHAYPFPCPLQCAEVFLDCGLNAKDSRGSAVPWEEIRAQGTRNEFLKEGEVGVMRIAGEAEASNGYLCRLDALDGAEYGTLKLRVRGTSNARFFVDIRDPWEHVTFSSGWQDTPQETKEFTFELPDDKKIGSIILYTWTTNGALAENIFEEAAFMGEKNQVAVSLGAPPAQPMPAHLSLEKAKATISAVPDKSHGAVIRALAHKNVFLVESEAKATLRTVTPDFLPPAQEGQKDGVEYIVQEVPGDLDWEGMRYAVAMARRDSKMAVSIVSSQESDDPCAEAIALAKNTLAEDDAIARHEAIWRDYWSASGVAMDDAVLEQAWYRSLYFLRCVTKPGVVSPGLFAGLINATPAWHGDYHLNYNLQQTFWSAYITNHCDLAEPYDRLMLNYVTRGQWLARQVYDCEGAFYPHVLYAYEPQDPATCKSVNGRQYIHHVWGLTLGVAGFAVQPLWWHYKYAPDPDLLRSTTYPPLREVALFYAAFIEGCERNKKGQIRLGPTVSPEHWGWTAKLERNYDCAFDIAMVRYTFEAAIEAARILDTDRDLVERWEAALKVLPAYPTQDNIVVDVDGAPPINYNISVPATPVFPGDVVTWWSDDTEKALFTRTIGALEWNGNNATFMLAISRARLGMEGSPAWLRDEIVARQRPNGTLTLNRLGHHFNNFGHYTEQFGAAQAVSELLLQSVGDIIRVLPAWPLEKPVRFENLRAQGGFLVSGGCEDGKLLPVEITSTMGGSLQLAISGERFSVEPKEIMQDIERDARGVVTIETKAGETLRVEVN